VTNELASSILQVGRAYQDARKPIPAHVAADLQDVAKADNIAASLRSNARLMLEEMS
jgi:hypothetical protein